MTSPPREPPLQVVISEEPRTVLMAERLRDGRVAIGTRTQGPAGEWLAGDLHLLDPQVQLDLAAWLVAAVEDGWIDTVRRRQIAPVRTAGELYGEGPGALARLALNTMSEIPPPLLARAMMLLANSLGPTARDRLVEQLNETANGAEDAELRRRMADENQAFAYAIAAAGLYDALSRGIYPEDVEPSPG